MKFSKDYPVKPDNDITFKPEDSTFLRNCCSIFHLS